MDSRRVQEEETAKSGHNGPQSDRGSPSEFNPRAIQALVGSFGVMFCTVGFGNSFGVFEEYYKQRLLTDQTRSTISWLGAINIFFLFAGSILTGPILDRSGPVAMFYLGTIGSVVSVMLTSVCKEFYQFVLAQGILLGVSMTLMACPMLALISQHFQRQRSAALGVTMAGSSLGGVFWPIIVYQLLRKPNVGFGWTMRIVGFIMLPILALSAVLARPPVKEDTASSSTSVSSQYQSEVEKPGTTQKPDVAQSTWAVLTRTKLLLSCAGFFIIYFGLFTPLFYVPGYGFKNGFSASISFYSVSIINGASLFGRIITGIIADRCGAFNSCIIVTLLSGIIALCWTSATTVSGLVVFSAAYGFTSGGVISLQQACAAQVATRPTVGTVIGTVMAATSLSSLAGTPISGQLVGEYGYLATSIYTGCSLILGAIFLIWARLSQNRCLLAVV